MNETQTPTIEWFKSTFSNNGGDCVEVSRSLLSTDGVILVRDSKNPEVAPMSFTQREWAAFVRGAAAGQFDL